MNRTAVGIDLGARTIRVVQVRLSGTEARADRALTVDRAALRAAGVDCEQRDQLAAALKARIAAEGIRCHGVTLGIEPQESILRYLHLPPMASRRLELVLKYEVDAVAERMSESVASDFGVLPVMREVDGEQNVLLGLAKEAPLAETLTAFEKTKVPVSMLVPGPLALFAAWELFGTKADPDSPDDDLLVLVDLGAVSLHIVLVLNNRLAFARSATFGGDNFTRAIQENLQIDFDKAERAKERKGGVTEELPGVLAETVAPLRGMAGQLLATVQSTLRLASNQIGVQLPAVTRLWVTGGGMRLRGLPEYLGKALGSKPVELFDPSVASQQNGSTTANLGLAVGLSAVGLGLNQKAERGVRLNILPESYKVRRHFRERTLFLYAAATLLVVLLAAELAVGIWRNSNTSTQLNALQDQLATLERQQGEVADSMAQAARSRALIDRLLKEAEVNSFQAFVLDLLGRSLRPEMQMERIWLEPVEIDDGRSIYLLTVDGRVNNERRLGLDWILELQNQLQSEERIREVQVTKNDERGAWIQFRLEIEPNNLTS